MANCPNPSPPADSQPRLAERLRRTYSGLLHTESGQLEPLSVAHAAQLYELIGDSRDHLQQWLPWPQRVHSTEDAETFVRDLLAKRGPQFLVRADGRACGGVGFHSLDCTAGVASLGYWLARRCTGKGIMRDAVAHLCRHGFDHYRLRRIEIRCATTNTNSRRVAESLGFYLEGKELDAEQLASGYVDHVIYSVLEPELRQPGE